MGVLTHAPVPGVQVSTVHTLESSQDLGAYTHPTDGWQPSVVQAFPSLHVMGVYAQPVGSTQASVVHNELSLQIVLVVTHPTLADGQLRLLHVVDVHVGHEQDPGVLLVQVQNPRHPDPHKFPAGQSN